MAYFRLLYTLTKILDEKYRSNSNMSERITKINNLLKH